MGYVIFEVKSDHSGNINIFVKDDLISRQSILTRDANALNIDKEVTFVKIEGSDEGLKRAKEFAKELEFGLLKKKEAAEINEKIAEQEESAADGMGMIFG